MFLKHLETIFRVPMHELPLDITFETFILHTMRSILSLPFLIKSHRHASRQQLSSQTSCAEEHK